MTPMKTANCNLVLTLPGCADLPVVRSTAADGHQLTTVTSYWQPSEEERQLLAAGYPLVLSFLGDTHPPILVRVADDA